MATTVGDILFQIEKYNKLKNKFIISSEEQTKNEITTQEAEDEYIKSKLTHSDLTYMYMLLDYQITALKNKKIMDDEN